MPRIGKGESGSVKGCTMTVVLVAAALSGGCSGLGDLGTSSLKPTLGKPRPVTTASVPAGQSELQKAIAYWGKKHAENPKKLQPALNFVRNLKAAGRKRQALRVLQQASFFHGTNREFAGEYGRLILSFGHASLAEKLLKAANDPAKPDWRILSALGTAAAKQGKYKVAISHYNKALTLSPQQPSVLNNLAMAHAASGRAAEAEFILRRAAAEPSRPVKIEKNLALVMRLQGKPFTGLTSDTRVQPSQTKAVAVKPTAPNATQQPALRGPSTVVSQKRQGWVTRTAKTD